MIKQIPNAITLFNLLCGCWAIVAALQRAFEWMLLFFVIGLVADFLDGALARALNASSALGKQLDSLSDMVTFGVLPAMMVFQIFGEATIGNDGFFQIGLFSFLIAVFTAIRLGKFNLDEGQQKIFSGLPSPANAMMICGVFLLYHEDFLNWRSFIGNSYFLLPFIFSSCLLLVAPIPFFSLKIQGLKWGGNELLFVFILFSILLIILWQKFAMAFIILLYIFISLILALTSYHKN